MPLTGELEHLPIVDVIQLIHSTRKSGTLNVYSRAGEGQLVFNDGYIISATHSSEKLKIGRILLASEQISQEDLDKALQIQNSAGDQRQPIIATLINHCGLSKDAAFKALESLIEMTVVEMISWTRGIFTLDVDEVDPADNYQYLPEQLQSISLDTQMVLLEALRIFDEKVHNGEIELSTEPLEEDFVKEKQTPAEQEPDNDQGDDEIELSEDILGLADLDKIERRKPRVFKGLETFDPANIHQQVISTTLPNLSEEGRKQLVNYLVDIATPFNIESSGQSVRAKSQAVIIYTCDEFLQHAIMTVCKREGILVFVTADENELTNLINRALHRYLEPILVFGSPDPTNEEFSEGNLINTRSLKMAQYPQVSLLQLAAPMDFSFSLQSLNDGARAVFPLPSLNEPEQTFATDMVAFLGTFRTYIRGCFNEERRLQFARLRNSLSGLRLLRKAPDISLLVLQYVAEPFERALTMIVDQDQLILERSIGIFSDKLEGASAPLNIRLPIRKDSAFRSVIQSRELFFGTPEESSFSDLLFPQISAPLDSTVLLLPLVSNERVITLTYADFGAQKAEHSSLDFIEFFASQAGIAMENALFRKRLKYADRAEP